MFLDEGVKRQILGVVYGSEYAIGEYLWELKSRVKMMMMKGGDFKLLLRTCEGKLRSDRPLEATLEASRSLVGLALESIRFRAASPVIAGKPRRVYYGPTAIFSHLGHCRWWEDRIVLICLSDNFNISR